MKPMPDTITYRGAVSASECDHMGHMNITWYTHKFDQANWNLFAAIGITPSYLREGKYGMAGVQQNVSYKRELFAGDVVEIRTRILEVRDKLIRFVHEMLNSENGEVAATCEMTAVHLDRTTRKSAPFPPEILARARQNTLDSE